MFDGYLALGDPLAAQVTPGSFIELINNGRTATLARQYGFDVRCTSCASMQPAGPVDPKTLPWYDPAVPESAEFLGFLGLQIGGLSKQPGIRNPLRAGNSGAVLGRIQQTYREIVVHCYAVATTQCGLSYGLSFLSGMLRGSCSPGFDPCTQGMQLTLYTCCNVANNSYRRQLYNVGLLQGPELTSKKSPGGMGGCNGYGFWGGDITFSLAAPRPWLYRDPVPIAANVPFVLPVYWPCFNWVPDSPQAAALDCSASPSQACVTWTPYDPVKCSPSCGGVGTGTCVSDPHCATPVEPPLAPDSGDPCACLMSLNPFVVTARSADGAMPKWSELVPYVVVQADNTLDMRRLLVRFYKSKAGATCNYNNLSACDLGGEIGIPFLPKGSTLILDGRAQTAKVICADGSTQRPMLYSTAGPAATWPVLECSTSWCVAVTIDPASLPTDANGVPLATNANITVSLVARESAS